MENETKKLNWNKKWEMDKNRGEKWNKNFKPNGKWNNMVFDTRTENEMKNEIKSERKWKMKQKIKIETTNGKWTKTEVENET